MSERRSLTGEARPPTWSERERTAVLREKGIEDVYVEPEKAPDEFWTTVVLATTWHLAGENAVEIWEAWEREIRFAHGWGDLYWRDFEQYQNLVEHGAVMLGNEYRKFPVGTRITAVEHLLDLSYDSAVSDFADAVNERATHFRVGLRVEGRRFIPLTSEHIHTDVVKPVLLLLSDPEFETVDSLYRKAFTRILDGDTAGAITASTSAVEEMMRIVLGETGSTLGKLAARARSSGVIVSAVEQTIIKLAALRDESDAHTKGTDSPAVGMFAVQTAAVTIRHLAEVTR